jgi:hypothetical protein
VPGREGLAARQAALVAALVAGAGVPAMLDADRVRIQAAALLRKRGSSVAHAQPELTWALGESFWTVFTAYGAGRPRQCCSARDAADFARYLLSTGHARDRQVRRAARRITQAAACSCLRASRSTATIRRSSPPAPRLQNVAASSCGQRPIADLARFRLGFW